MKFESQKRKKSDPSALNIRYAPEMNKKLSFLILAGVTLASILPFTANAGQQTPEPAKTTKVDFIKTIVPIVKENCISCHTKGYAKDNVEFPEKMTEEEAIKNPKLWRKAAREVKAGHMPPKGQPKLTEKQIADFTEWIDAKIPKKKPNV
jgi:mono/diheme cytochrome c family protein